MASISSAGIGSGLDVETIVTQLMAVERQPLTQMKTQATKIDSKISAYGKLQSYTSALRDAASNLTKAATWGSSTAASADSSVVSASGNTKATAGSYSVSVQQLAASQSLASSAFGSSASTLGSGTLTLELGTWSADQSSFTAKSGATPVSVSVLATDTLAQVRDKINAAGGGVSASIVNDASGSRLVMHSSATGEENGFRVQVADDDGDSTDSAGLSALAYDPSASVSSMSRTQAAANARATVNGLTVTSASNTLEEVVEGVTLKLGKVSASPVEVTVSSNTESIKKSITDFATAYNDLAKYLSTQTRYDSASKTAGSLQGDASVNALRSALRGVGTGSVSASATYQRLADIGLDPQSDGTLKVDDSKLTEALGNLGEMKKLFANVDGVTSANEGFAVRLRKWGDAQLSTSGSLTSRSNSLQRQKDANSDQQETFENRMTAVEKRMRAQYTALDTQMAKMNQLSSYVSQQLSVLTYSS
ncbi:MAG: flagellar filament capping protein FliD [Burkholderiales bacterium]|jgi:flagellar hook-associated protein 2|nr:flagellar filament capping protein FliD [Burkholderiales bacterium]MBP7518958.1 flagellar filament capping protein FliD [Leptothrix sp. (in: b-proteobacteria)]HQY07165.1 flagellar filament capping protein FliD [Burkholderiaceae bacterium]